MYAFCGNIPLIFADFWGLKSIYVPGFEEPPRGNKIKQNTWNTSEPNRYACLYWAGAVGNIFGGHLLINAPDAANFLAHFLSNTGTPLEIDFKRMNRESKDAKRHLKYEIINAIKYAEKLSDSCSQRFIVMVTEKESNVQVWDNNWHYAVLNYTTWARGKVLRKGNCFYMEWDFYFRDIYDWNSESNGRGGLVTDKQMAHLHRCGFAKEFEINGCQTLYIWWKKGERDLSKMKIKGL